MICVSNQAQRNTMQPFQLNATRARSGALTGGQLTFQPLKELKGCIVSVPKQNSIAFADTTFTTLCLRGTLFDSIEGLTLH